MDLLLGLDMLKRYQATIDLAKDKLIVQGEEIPFLGEAEIPKDEDGNANETSIPGPAGTSIGSQSGAVHEAPGPGQQATTAPAPAPASAPQSASATTSTAAPNTGAAQPQPAAAKANVSPQNVEMLVGMGATREQAIQALQAAEDNVDVAASLIFF